MNKADFMAGKYGVSHASIAVGMVAVGTGIGAAIGAPQGAPVLGAALGNLWAAGGAACMYYMREVVQHRSWLPWEWSLDGQWDFGLPAGLMVANTLGVAAWILTRHAG